MLNEQEKITLKRAQVIESMKVVQLSSNRQNIDKASVQKSIKSETENQLGFFAKFL